jgi:hypothetical protein
MCGEIELKTRPRFLSRIDEFWKCKQVAVLKGGGEASDTSSEDDGDWEAVLAKKSSEVEEWAKYTRAFAIT